VVCRPPSGLLMLQAFRQKGLTSAVYGVLIVATIVVFVIGFRPGANGATGSIKIQCALEVRALCVDPKEYYAELGLIAPGRMIEGSQAKALGVRRATMEGIVERILLVQDADRLGLTVSEDEINGELTEGRFHVSLPVDRSRALGSALGFSEDMVRVLPVRDPETKKFDYKIYERTVRQYSNRSPTEFKKMQIGELLAARMRDLVRSRVRVGEEEAFAVFRREKSSATIRFVALHRDWFVQHVVDSSPQAVEAWAKQHDEELSRVFETRKAQYEPECREARHVLVKLPDGPTDDQKAEARKRIDDVLLRLQGGEDFAKVAREVSQDQGSAAHGGSLGCFGRGRMVKPFDDAAFSMKPGDLSGVVETQYGYHVIRLEQVYTGQEALAVGRRETAKTLMEAQQGEALASETGKKILALVKAGKKLDQALAEALPKPTQLKAASKTAADEAEDERTPKVEISASFPPNGDPIPGASGQSPAQLAFRLANDGDTPDDLIKLDDGYAVMQLKEKAPATREQFDKDRETFIAQLLAGKQTDALNGYVARLKDSAKSETRFNDAYIKTSEKDKQGEDEE
jgi:peptidyl-prolyl cis-trans isomerase D